MDGIPVQAVEQTMPDPNAVGACPRPARPGLGVFTYPFPVFFNPSIHSLPKNALLSYRVLPIQKHVCYAQLMTLTKYSKRR